MKSQERRLALSAIEEVIQPEKVGFFINTYSAALAALAQNKDEGRKRAASMLESIQNYNSSGEHKDKIDRLRTGLEAKKATEGAIVNPALDAINGLLGLLSGSHPVVNEIIETRAQNGHTSDRAAIAEFVRKQSMVAIEEQKNIYRGATPEEVATARPGAAWTSRIPARGASSATARPGSASPASSMGERSGDDSKMITPGQIRALKDRPGEVTPEMIDKCADTVEALQARIRQLELERTGGGRASK